MVKIENLLRDGQSSNLWVSKKLAVNSLCKSTQTLLIVELIQEPTANAK